MVNLPVEAALPQQGTEERLQIYAVVIYNFYDSGSSLWIDKIFVTDCDHDGYLLSLDTRLIGDRINGRLYQCYIGPYDGVVLVYILIR